MSNKFKAIVIDNQNEKFTRNISELDTAALKNGNVLVKVDYSSLNFKDALILNNGATLVKTYPHVPGIDFSGTVDSSEDTNFKKGDKIILTGFRVGEIYYGGFSQYAKVDSKFLVKLPNGISTLQSMMMGTAGFTAMLCSFAVKAREELLLGEKVNDVLVTGATGGVGSIAVMILSKMGYNVTAVTGKQDKHDFLKNLGAKNILDRKEFEGEGKLLEKGIWDGVVETVGGQTLAKVLAQTKPTGIVAACGNAGGIKLNTSVMPFIIRGVKLWGIDSSASTIKRRLFVWDQVKNYVDLKKLEEISQILSLQEVLDIYPKMLKGGVFGRVVVDPNK